MAEEHRGEETVSAVFGAAPESHAPETPPPTPRTIGPYTIGERLGEGGFGAVYAAAQEGEISRRVAIKLLRPGAASAQVLARFRRERHILALMKHPNIAQVYDAGETADGRPFIAMELVEGPTITRYCDERKLGIRQRLGLFRQVCHAVQHAHTKGVIHRDIKPSNVLVATDDGRPVVKVIDFGIARPTDPNRHAPTVETTDRQLIGTPSYMSPEQARGSDDIDTRSDVFSLGVVLYELLAGLLPIDPDALKGKSASDVDRIINQEDPPSPSTRIGRSSQTRSAIAAQRSTAPADLTRMLRGELDWVVMRCLQKNPDRRYQTAADLDADIERHLAGAAVLAAPPSAAYRLRKFVRRHRLPVAVGTGVLSSLAIGLGATLFALGEARAQERLARREATRSGAFAKLFVEDVIGAVHPTESGGQDLRMSEVLKQAEMRLDSITDSSVRADVQLQIGRMMLGLGEYQRAYDHFKAALPLREKDPYATPEDRAMPYAGMGWACRSLEREEWGLAYAQQALTLLREAYGAPSVLCAVALGDIAWTHRSRGDLRAAHKAMTDALTEASIAEEPGHESETHAKLMMQAANLLYTLEGRYFEAAELYAEAIEILERVDAPALTTAYAIAVRAQLLADAGAQRGDVEDIERAVAIARRAYAQDNPHLANYLASLATVYAHAGRMADAESLLREALAICEATFGAESEIVAHRTLKLAILLEAQDRQTEAIELCAKARQAYLSKFGPDDSRTLNAQSLLGDLCAMTGSYEEAEKLLVDAFERMQKTGASSETLMRTRNRLTKLFSLTGDDAKKARWSNGG